MKVTASSKRQSNLRAWFESYSCNRIDFRFYAIADAGGTLDYMFPATVYSLTSRYPGGANPPIEFDSETILPDFSSPCGTTLPGWSFGMTLTETEGVGVKITSYIQCFNMRTEGTYIR